jgi:coenzyme F420-0:L-glutamate ligase / coenzyme F420-1:gamma-L-glutamate ligase
MPDLFETIKQRRSIRKLQTKPVPDVLVEQVLEAASWAPSAHNSQPWRFIILKDPAVKRALSEAMVKAWAAELTKDGEAYSERELKQKAKRFEEAPVLLLACQTMEGLRTFPDAQRQSCERNLAQQSFGAAIQNLLLAAHALGLGACWYCAPGFCKETVRENLKIPSAVEPEAFIVLGFPAEKPPVPERKPLGEYCFLDVWKGKI